MRIADPVVQSFVQRPPEEILRKLKTDFPEIELVFCIFKNGVPGCPSYGKKMCTAVHLCT